VQHALLDATLDQLILNNEQIGAIAVALGADEQAWFMSLRIRQQAYRIIGYNSTTILNT
jgi:hypothetical protein